MSSWSIFRSRSSHSERRTPKRRSLDPRDLPSGTSGPPDGEKEARLAVSDVRRAISIMYLAGYSREKARTFVASMPEYQRASKREYSLKNTELCYMAMQHSRHPDYLFVTTQGPRETRRLAEVSYHNFQPDLEETHSQRLQELAAWEDNWKDEISLLKSEENGEEAAQKYAAEITEMKETLELKRKRSANLEQFNRGEAQRKADLAKSSRKMLAVPKVLPLSMVTAAEVGLKDIEAGVSGISVVEFLE